LFKTIDFRHKVQDHIRTEGLKTLDNFKGRKMQNVMSELNFDLVRDQREVLLGSVEE